MLGEVEDLMGRRQVGPMVQRAHKGEIFKRKGRGFSLGELKKAGIEPALARRMSLIVDLRRKTVYDFNVETLNKFAIELRGRISQRSIVSASQSESSVERDQAEVETVEAAR